MKVFLLLVGLGAATLAAQGQDTTMHRPPTAFFGWVRAGMLVHAPAELGAETPGQIPQLTAAIGAQIKPALSLNAGTGVILGNTHPLIPAFFEVQATLSKKRIAPTVYGQVGGVFPMRRSVTHPWWNRTLTVGGGGLAGMGAGLQIRRMGRESVQLGLGYHVHHFKLNYRTGGAWGSSSIEYHTASRLALQATWLFW